MSQVTATLNASNAAARAQLSAAQEELSKLTVETRVVNDQFHGTH